MVSVVLLVDGAILKPIPDTATYKTRRSSIYAPVQTFQQRPVSYAGEH